MQTEQFKAFVSAGLLTGVEIEVVKDGFAVKALTTQQNEAILKAINERVETVRKTERAFKSIDSAYDFIVNESKFTGNIIIKAKNEQN
jgi:hypothetical protein